MATRLRMAKTVGELDAYARQRDEQVRKEAENDALYAPLIAEFERALEKVKRRYSRATGRIEAKIKRLDSAMLRSARKLRRQLIPGTTKTAKLPSGGEISFRSQPDKPVVQDEKAAIAWLAQAGPEIAGKYLRVEPELNLEALGLEANRQEAEAIPGINFEEQEERIYYLPPSGGKKIQLKED
ncbi:MAG TPA: host-nuclease inhibitor Gam family protein [Candidatus Saccharimonadales bacterium]|nr:host-nuclease inhibitor Gam family protein [Candidatus Saccharimonadales bacterium]